MVDEISIEADVMPQLALWQMLCQCVADTMATLLQWKVAWSFIDMFWQMSIQGLADGMSTVFIRVAYLSLSSGVLNRTPLQVCGRWYFPMSFLVMDH